MSTVGDRTGIIDAGVVGLARPMDAEQFREFVVHSPIAASQRG